MAVYLLHFDRPFHHAQHYTGFTVDLERRLAQHRSPTNHTHNRLMQAIHESGIGFKIGRVWPDGDRELERRLKRWRQPRRICEICRGK
jgi:hypothetical protein